MQFGSKVDSTGKSLSATNTVTIMKGERVPGNKILSFGMAKDQNENPVTDRAEIVFLQSNGAKFSYAFFSPNPEKAWTLDKLNREMLHICTKIVPETDYYSAVDGSTDFQSFISNIQQKVIPQAEGKTFTLKIVMKENTNSGKWFANFPTFPNFIELDGTEPSTLTTNPQYDFYTVPAESTPEETTTGEPAATGDDLF